MQAIDLPTLNALDQAAFTHALAGIFEKSPWIGREAWLRRPFDDIAALHRCMMAIVTAADPNARLALIRAHPDLATKAATAGALTAESRSEQAGAGLDQLTQEEFARFHTLNSTYGQRFGFPFIICVRNVDKAGILSAFERRLSNTAEVEQDEAIRQIGDIAWLRLTDAIRHVDRGGLDNSAGASSP